MSRRSLLAGAGLGALGLGAASCGSNTGRGGSAPGSLRQWYHAYGEDGVHEAVRRYAAEYPGGEVSVQWNPGDYDSKIVTALQGGSAPDVFEAQVKLDWVRQGQVVPLDDLVAVVRGDFPARVLETATVEGRLYAVPQAVDTQVLCYRRSRLAEAGVRPPGTVDELVDATARLSSPTSKGLFVGNDGGVGVLAGPLLWSAGLDYLSPDGRRTGFDDPRAARAFGKLAELGASGGLLLGAPADWSDPSAFTSGLAAMQWTGSWNLPKIAAALGDDFGVLPFPPLDERGAPSVPVGAYGATVHARGADVAAAKDFVRWLWIERTDHQLEFATAFGFHVPARTSLAERAGPRSGPAAEAVRFTREHAHLVGGPMWTSAANSALSDALFRIARQGADPEAETREAVAASDAELKRLHG